MDWVDLFLIPAVKVLVIFLVMVLSVPAMVFIERKLIGRMQLRPGPNRIGVSAVLQRIFRNKEIRNSPITKIAESIFRNGELQAIIDGIKLVLKEDFIPAGADRIAFAIAPAIAVIPAFLSIAIIPIGPEFQIELFGKVRTIWLEVTNLPMGILFYFAVTSIGVYGIVLAGWASNSKYSLLGGIRSAAQILSYELTLGMSLVGVLLIVGSFEMRPLLDHQDGGIWNWHVFQQPVGAALFLIGGFAETNRLPFDLPEGESELGAGFHTEFSSLKFAMFMMAEYLNIIAFSGMMITLFLGGYHGPIPLPFALPVPLAIVSAIFWFSLKLGAIFFFFVWARGTLPRLRYDQLMNLGWKILFPIAATNVMVTAVIVALGLPFAFQALALAVAGGGMIWAVDRFAIAARKRALGHA